jgi:hypothetical protein
MTRFYAGIGSRETPPVVCRAMTRMAIEFRRMGYVLRSGGADGADEAFEAGAGTDKLIYLPWVKFRNNPSPYHRVTPEALALAARFHPAWGRLNEYARRLHGRNAYQVLGLDLRTKADFVVCWTKGGKGGGGTGQAIRMAFAYGIPVYDLALWTPDAVLGRVRELTSAAGR